MRLSGRNKHRRSRKRCLGVRKKIRGSLQDVSGPRKRLLKIMHRGCSFSRPHCGLKKSWRSKTRHAAAENRMEPIARSRKRHFGVRTSDRCQHWSKAVSQRRPYLCLSAQRQSNLKKSGESACIALLGQYSAASMMWKASSMTAVLCLQVLSSPAVLQL